MSNYTKAEALLDKSIALAVTAGNLPVEQALRLARAQLVLDLCQYADHNRSVDVEADLEASQSNLDPLETLTWWLRWQELSGLLGAVTGDTQRMISTAESSLKHVTNVLEQAESFAEKAEYLSRLSFIADLGILGYLSEAGPPAGLRFARRVFARLIGSETAVFQTPEGVAELYLLNPVTPDWCGVLVSAGESCTFYELESVGKDFWNEAIDELRPGFFSGMSALRQPGGTGQFADLLEEWVLAASGALGPVLTDLHDADYKEIVVFAFGGWCTVPVSALQLPGPQGSALIEQAAIAHGPDQFVAHEPRLDRVLHVVDARLTEAKAETKMLQSFAKEVVTCTVRRDVQAVLGEGQAFDCIHFTTHGEHDFDHLEGVGIRCADDELLTARWFFENAKLKGGPLVCLAACQTGLSDFANLPHETFGLPMAFLAAGASAVIGTQWPVDDVATRLLITRFYLELKSGCSTAESLRRAQLWLRNADDASLEDASTGAMRFSSFDGNWQNPDLPPFSHAYFWAGFVLHRA
ncbi:CHAT domain protein [Pelagimonas phthalicica]|uniref:CHAT domain protein n=1 Tax=Pelagimonas phthalicica TaxID=1037362 RepID=A0A238JEW2_9RHOB|nr:CHAT domain-containing protein [Pelagimonas phthalicica]TDS92119.1 CHAT domain-containing protein [Pelagimonas phthalicica]SMX29169.1 CHAT domain protein [Pelagimonas phthalicica]